MTPWIVFTALDGCLLDSGTHAFEPARQAVDELKRSRVPLVFCTAGTAGEALHYQDLLGIQGPFAVEGGGGVYVPRGYVPRLPWDHVRRGNHDLIPFTVERDAILDAFADLREATGNSIRGFHEMSDEEVAADTGLPLPVARLALKREFDEPFKFVRGEAELAPLLPRLARELGLRVTRESRYYRLHGDTDKGLAIEVLKSIFRMKMGGFRSLGIGDAEPDLPMLKAVDVPAAVQRPDGSHDPALVKGVRGLRCIPNPGPTGWNRAVLEVLGAGEDGA